jgi:serine/threonine-protein kinase
MNERYQLTRLFSRGGMAELYLGTAVGAEGFEKRVAIKRILPHLAEDPEVARMFVAEAKLATYLSHQNIIQVFDVGRGPNGVFIVMELVDGWDLGVIVDKVKQNLAIPPPLAAFIASQAMAGLCYAYRQTHQGQRIIVAHRDLSPSNLLLSAEGEVKVGDFGIARLEAFHKTEPGTFKGKVPYSAPEVLRGEPATAASDQFSLGVVLYEMLSGRHPFGHFENALSYVDPIINRPALALSEAPPALAEIVDRSLRKSPAERFTSPESFAKALAQFLASTGTPTTTNELAEFLGGLKLPRRPSELSPQDTIVTGGFSGSFSLQHPLSPPPNKSAGPPARIAPPKVPKVAPLNPSPYAGQTEDFQRDWVPTGPTVDAEGRIHQAPGGKPVPAPLPSPPKPNLLELATPVAVPLASPVWFEPPLPELSLAKRSRLTKSVVIALLAIAAWAVLMPTYRWARKQLASRTSDFAHLTVWSKSVLSAGEKLKASLPEGSFPVLQIESDPPGAVIQIGEERIGKTPLYTENIYPRSEIEVRLSLSGYYPWKSKFPGGETAVVKAKLKRR